MDGKPAAMLALAVLIAACAAAPPRPRKRRRVLNPIDRAHKQLEAPRPMSVGLDGFEHPLLKVYSDKLIAWTINDLGYEASCERWDAPQVRRAVRAFQSDWNAWAAYSLKRSIPEHGWIDELTLEALHVAKSVQDASDQAWSDVVNKAIDAQIPQVV